MKLLLKVESGSSSFNREFDSLKSMRQFERRNVRGSIKATRFVRNNDQNQWERFVIIGSTVVSKSQLQQFLSTIE